MATADDVKNALATTTPGKKNNPMVNRLKKELEVVLSSKKKLLDKVKEGKAVAGRVGMHVVNKGEAATMLVGASVIAARLGTREDGKPKIKLGGKVDARYLIAIPMELAALWLTAVDSAAASHISSVGGGIGGSAFADMGREIGEAWREKATGSAGSSTGGSNPDLGGIRELAMTDSTIDTTAGHKADDENNRFRTAVAAGSGA